LTVPFAMSYSLFAADGAACGVAGRLGRVALKGDQSQILARVCVSFTVADKD
jgi:hypothetical protein